MNTPAHRLLYVIVDPERMDMSRLQEATGQLGVMGQPLETIPAGALAVVASPVPDRPSLVSPPVDEVLTFRSVIEAVFGAGPVVPLRFGTVAESPEQAATLVREKEATYRDLLSRLEGRVEMGVSVELKADEDASEESETPKREAERPGTTYLRKKQERLARERARVEEIVSPFQRAVTEEIADVTLSPPTVSGGRVSIAYLIPREEVERFHQTVEQVQQTVERVQAPGVSSVEIVGPWAPYSFV